MFYWSKTPPQKTQTQLLVSLVTVVRLVHS